MGKIKSEDQTLQDQTLIPVKSVQNWFLLPILSCAQVVGIQDCAYSALRENLCAGAKKHFWV